MIMKSLIFVFLSVSISVSLVSAELNIQQVVCNNYTGNYTDNSVYHRNLIDVLSSLSNRPVEYSFYNATAGVGVNTVYALYSCAPDVEPVDCLQCVNDAADSILVQCPFQKEAISFSRLCKLRYANRNIFSRPQTDPHGWWCSIADQVPMNHSEFEVVVGDGLTHLIRQVTSNQSSGLFGSGEVDVGVGGRVRMVVQCTPDLTADDCEWCLQGALRFDTTLCGSALVWTIIVLPSCQLEYRTIIMPREGSQFLSPPPPSSPIPVAPLLPRHHHKNHALGTIVAIVIIGLLILIGVVIWMMRNKLPKWSFTMKKNSEEGEKYIETADCLSFDFQAIEKATRGFSLLNKLGEGGFGIVYEGVLENGTRVAVKRLSQKSVQGSKEFKTELGIVAKLQHKNLVKLIGFCVKGEERLIVYEFMPNLSLDRFLFDPTKSCHLTWVIRLKIITGIARGLQYLHEDSRVTIVHRDLKSSNILLDDELEPKIADFGMARFVNIDQTSDITSRVVGTYGYMAPEYVSIGRVSVKSDVYSFGVLILEILSGKSNNQFYQMSHGGLIRRTRKILCEDKIEELMDPVLGSNYSRIEALRCLQIGLACAQEDESNRPSMNAVLVMLASNSIELPSLTLI